MHCWLSVWLIEFTSRPWTRIVGIYRGSFPFLALGQSGGTTTRHCHRVGRRSKYREQEKPTACILRQQQRSTQARQVLQESEAFEVHTPAPIQTPARRNRAPLFDCRRRCFESLGDSRETLRQDGLLRRTVLGLERRPGVVDIGKVVDPCPGAIRKHEHVLKLALAPRQH